MNTTPQNGDLKTTTITVKAVRILRTGVGKNGRPYTIFSVEAVNERGIPATLTTFDAAWQQRVGQTHPIKYKIDSRPGRDGQTRTELQIVSESRGGMSPAVLGEIRELLKDQNALLREQKELLESFIALVNAGAKR